MKLINKMKTQTIIPMLTKSKVHQNTDGKSHSSCCTPKGDATVCCTSSDTTKDNDGACCAQPEDGSACCNK